MKKQNRSVCTYIRTHSLNSGQANFQNNQQSLPNTKIDNTQSNPNIYKQIVGQMDPQITSYLNKLVSKNQKEQDRKKLLLKSVNHQRTKSYADIFIGSPTNTKNYIDKGHSYRGSHASATPTNTLFSINNTPITQTPPYSKISQKYQITNGTISNQFLQHLDLYIINLSSIKSSLTITNNQSPSHTSSKKNIQKTKQNNANNNLQLIQKLQLITKKQKQLQLTNHILQMENNKLKQKINKIKNKYQTIFLQLYQYNQSLEKQLHQTTKQKRKLQSTIQDFQEKFAMLRPQRKTSAVRPHIHHQQYIISSQTTEQDIPPFIPTHHHQHFYETEFKNKHMKRKSVPRTTAKPMRASGPIQISAMLAENNFQVDDEELSSNQEN